MPEGDDPTIPAPGSGKDDKPDADGMTSDEGRRALQAEKERARALKKQVDELTAAAKAAGDKDKTEVQRLTDENAALKNDLATATVSGARLKVALEKGLSAGEAKRLVGATEEELLADADEYLVERDSHRGSPPPPSPPPPPGGKPREQLRPGGTNPEVEPDETNLDHLAKQMFGG